MPQLLEDDLYDEASLARPLSPSKDLMEDLLLWRSAIHRDSPAYLLPSQTIIFYDWDETLFPTEAIMSKWKIQIPSTEEQVLSQEQEEELKAWREALREVLEQASVLAGKCVIVTNATNGWVENCIDQLAPDLKYLFNTTNGVQVVYARDNLRQKKPELHRRMTMVNPSRYGASPSIEEVNSALTLAKYIAMKEQVAQFYSQYELQTWKNILSFGDSCYECDALRDVAFRRVPPAAKDEKLRAKCMLWPTCPTVSELTLRLRFHEAMLRTYIRFDGNLDLDLTTENDPLHVIAKALELPDLVSLPWLSHAWGLEKAPSRVDAEISLDVVKMITERRSSSKVATTADLSGDDSETSFGLSDGDGLSLPSSGDLPLRLVSI